MCYTPDWLSKGIKELWIYFGQDLTKRWIPLHDVVKHIGAPLARVIIKAHIPSGCDSISKIGTKKGALKFEPVKYLADFAEDGENTDSLAEEYLVRVENGANCKTSVKTFDELRWEQFCNSKRLGTLAPTSSVIKGHLKRADFLIYEACNLLNSQLEVRSTTYYGWEVQFGLLVPQKCLKPMPE